LLDHLNGDGFDYGRDRLLHFPRDFLHWRGFGLGSNALLNATPKVAVRR